MKTFTQFTEDVNRLEQRRKELRNRQLDQMQKYKERAAQYQASQKEKVQAARERESLKNEIKRELQSR